ncbi:MAG: SusC/RagA family protein [Niabella sp. SCN 42-15]|nr:MAG: SusC/RagA family protein [Niabella sp. SCN 42-15]
MNRILFLSLCVLFTAVAYAQTRQVNGAVTDHLGVPLAGATVSLEGSGTATQTNENGVFTITVPSSGSPMLVISAVGYNTQTVPVSGGSINVALTQHVVAGDEVVVIGYGTSRRKDLTGAISSISSQEIMKAPVANAAEALTGRLAGVQIAATEGSPDAELKVRVRGGGSITGDNTPLIIVDGFPVNNITDIAPADIESIDVLKDASSTAIYGSRGANGVIIVTTKSGKAGKFAVNYNVYGGYRKLANKLEVLSPSDYAKWQYEYALLDNRLNERYTKYFGNWQDIDLYNEVTPNDWQELVFGRLGSLFNHTLSLNGGTDKMRYAASYNGIKDKAIMQLSGYKRDNLSLKLNHRPNKKITLDFSARYSNMTVEGGGANEQNEKSSADSRLKYAMIYPPFPVGGLTDASETDDGFNMYHPIEALRDNDRLQRRQNLNLGGSFAWKLTQDLTFKTELGMDEVRIADDRFYGATTYYVRNAPAAESQGLPAIEMYKISRSTTRNTNTLNYDFRKLLTGKHRLNMLLGQEYIGTKSEILTTVVHGFPKTFSFYDARKLSAQGKANNIQNYLNPDDRLFSFFGRANYSFDSKYLFDVTFRADGSSKFAEGNKWGYFPSASAAWRISSEEAFSGIKNWFDDLKLRLSYGTAGNNNIPPGQMVQTFDVSNTTWINNYTSYWAASKTMANPDLKWETTVTRNIGLDFTTSGRPLSGTLDFYRNSTKDLLIQFPVPGTGYDFQYRNMGETRNQGVELTLNWAAVDKKNFGLNFSGNIGFNQNKIMNLGLMDNFGGTSGWASTMIGVDYMVQTGGSVGEMYGYRIDGKGRYEVADFERYDATTNRWILKTGVANAPSVVSNNIRPGSMKLKDLNGDGVINIDDREIIGNANPKHTGGFTINARAYGFDMSAIFNWSYGNDVYNANKIEYTTTAQTFGRSMIDIMADGSRWTNLRADGTISNDPAELEAMNAGTTLWSPRMDRYVFSDWAVEDGSFLRLGTLTLGYNLPLDMLRKVRIQNVRVYATGYNLWLLTNYTGFDPEVSTRRRTPLTPGVDYSAYPRSRMVVLGLNLNF